MYKVTTYLNEDSMPYLVKEETVYNIGKQRRFDDSDLVYELTKEMRMTDRATEMALLLIFDSAMHLICISELSTGCINGTVMSPREIALTMLLAGGSKCIIVHNHPSGDTMPSDTDIMTTNKIKKAIEMLNLQLLDHMVVGKYGYTSFCEQNLL